MHPDTEEARRLLDVLRTLLRMLGISNREVERRLKLKHSAVTRLFNGTVEAKLDLVLGIMRVAGLEYDEFFSFVYPERRAAREESDAARKIHVLIDNLHPPGLRSVTPGEERPAARRPAPAVEASSEAQTREEMLEDIRKVVREVLEEVERGPEPDDNDDDQ